MIGPRELPQPFFAARVPAFSDREPAINSRGMTTSMDKAIRLVGKHRDLDCERYDACLALAVSAEWQGFECAGCELFKGKGRATP